MFSTLVKRAQRQNVFFKDTYTKRQKEEQDYESHKSDLPPAFNKRLYSVQGSEGVVITGASMDVMARNAENIGNLNYRLSESELKLMKCVVEGLKAIHRGLAFVKEVLSNVVTLEAYEPLQYVRKKSNDQATFCYYILDGAVEATYDGSHGQKLQIYEPDVLYTHRSGEYMGLVTYEGEDKDMAPAATIYSKTHVQMIRIDRKDFHERIRKLREELDNEKRDFIENGGTVLKRLPDAQKKEILIFMSKEIFGAINVVTEQNHFTDYIYFVASGHCDCVKRVFLPACGQTVLLNVGHLEEGQFFGEDRVTHDVTNYCSVITKTRTVCFKIHRAAFETGGRLRNALMKLIWEHKPTYPSVEELRELGTATYSWEVYKRLEASNSKDVHEDRQRVLQNTNLKYDDTNMMLNFLKGEFSEKDVRQSSANMPSKYKDLLGETVVADTGHEDDGAAFLTTSNASIFEDQENEQELKKSKTKKREKETQPIPIKTYVEEERRIVDSREIFKKFPGHIKPREGMLKMYSISNKKKKVEIEKKATLVAMEPDEIVVNARRQIQELAERVAKKKALASSSVVEESAFYKEHELAYTHHLVSRYRTNVLERKLRRNRYMKEEDIHRLKQKHAIEYIELGPAIEQDLNDGDKKAEQNKRKKEEQDDTGNSNEKEKSWRRGSLAIRRKRFVDKLSARLLSEGSLPALAKHAAGKGTGQGKTGDKYLSPVFPGENRRPSLNIELSDQTKAAEESQSGNKKRLLRTKTLPVIRLTSKMLVNL